MRNRMKRLLMAAPGVLILTFIIAGCATIERSAANDDESMLAAAGFQMKLADTPEKLAQIQAMPQRTFAAQKQGDEVNWSYADAEFCKCSYTGSESAYLRYEDLAIKKKIAETNPDGARDMDTFVGHDPGRHSPSPGRW